MGPLGQPWERYEKLLAALSDCAALDGLEFYAQLACTLAGGLEVRYALIAVLEGDGEAYLRTLAVWSDGDRVEDYTFPLAGTPCERVCAGGTFFCPRGAAALFPADPRLAALGIESYLGKPLFALGGEGDGGRRAARRPAARALGRGSRARSRSSPVARRPASRRSA